LRTLVSVQNVVIDNGRVIAGWFSRAVLERTRTGSDATTLAGQA